MWRNENERPGGLVRAAEGGPGRVREAVIGWSQARAGKAGAMAQAGDWRSRGPRYTRLMTSKADHHRPLPPRHSPSNPLALIFEGPFCDPHAFSVPLPPRPFPPSVRRRLLPCRVSAPPCYQGPMKLFVENYSKSDGSNVLPFFTQVSLKHG